MKTRKPSGILSAATGRRMVVNGWLLVLACGFIPATAGAAEPELRLDLGGGAGIDLVLIQAGGFTQGSPAEEAGRGSDETRRDVSISRAFYIGRTAVTRGQWERFVRETGFRSEAETGTSGGYGWDGNALVQKKQFTWRNPGFPQTSDHPVCLVTYPDAQAFCKWLERKTQRKTTLPTEAQWEYACRAGTATPWHAGSSADDAAWHGGNSAHSTHPVGSKPANAWGLFIGGNVSEWCLDWYAPYQAGPVTDPRQDNPNLSDKPRRVLRGGSWLRDAKNTRSAARYRADPRSRNADTGFRIVCAVDVPAPPPPRSPEPVRLQAEAEPGVTPPMPAPRREALPGLPQRGGGFGVAVGRLLGSLVCLLIPVGILVLIVRIIVKKGGKPHVNPFVVPPVPPASSRERLRKTVDGFWILGDWAAGTPLKVRYVTRGEESAMDLIYQPGPEGHFVFTGSMPDSISVVADSDDPLPPPFAPVIHDPFVDRPSAVSRPPRFPSAY